MRCHRGNLLRVYVSVSVSFRAIVPSTNHSRYPEIIDLHARNLVSVLLSQDSQDIQERLNEKLQSFTNGQIPHAAHAFSTLLGILAHYRASDQPPDVGSPNLQAKSKCTWVVGGNCKISPHQRSMNTALIRSMHHGSFLDMEYRVRKRRAGADQFAPLYISSTILLSRGIRSKLDARKSLPTPIPSALTDLL
jgi:hypothetical protein